MISIEVFVDPSCPWAWITSRWLREVAPHRDLSLSWRSYCLEIRDDYELPAGIAEQMRPAVRDGRALGHQMLRIFEAARAQGDEPVIDRLYTEWGRRFVPGFAHPDPRWLAEVLESAGADLRLLAAADDDSWDDTIVDSMSVASGFGGPKTQTPVVVIAADPPRGFKGPVMASAPTGDEALQMWDAIDVLSRQQGFFELTRPRSSPPQPPQVSDRR